MKSKDKKLTQQLLKRFKVKSERPAIRCDICHQSDQFDPHTNICLRCNGITKVAETKSVPVTYSPTEPIRDISSKINLWKLISVKLQIFSIFFLTVPLMENRKNIIFTAPIQTLIGISVIIQGYRNRASLGILLGLSAIIFNVLLYLFIVETKITRREARQLLPFIEFGYLCFCMFIIFIKDRIRKS